MKLRNLLLSCGLGVSWAGCVCARRLPQIRGSCGLQLRNDSARAILTSRNSYSLNGGGGSFDYNTRQVLWREGQSSKDMAATRKTQCTCGYHVLPQWMHGERGKAICSRTRFGPQVGLRNRGVFRPFGELLFGGAHSNARWKYIEDSRHHDREQGAVFERIRDDGGRRPGHCAEPLRFDSRGLGWSLITFYTRFNTSSINATAKAPKAAFGTRRDRYLKLLREIVPATLRGDSLDLSVTGLNYAMLICPLPGNVKAHRGGHILAKLDVQRKLSLG